LIILKNVPLDHTSPLFTGKGVKRIKLNIFFIVKKNERNKGINCNVVLQGGCYQQYNYRR